MILTDYHVHSSYSFDAKEDMRIEELARYAASNGVSRLAVCDHYDLNWVKSGENPDIDFAERAKKIEQSNRANPCVRLLDGIELGQATQEIEMAERVLGAHEFEVILGSLHNIRDMPDFFYIKYEDYSLSQLEDIYRQYLIELCELAEWGKFHILAHMTYPLRYFTKNNRFIALEKYRSYYRNIYVQLVKNGIALEVNTSGLRSNVKQTMPNLGAIADYIAAGGKRVVLGSDAHMKTHIGYKFGGAVERLKRIGAHICGRSDPLF